MYHKDGTLMYPDDGGLGEPVRSFEDTFSMTDMFLKEIFGISTKEAMDHRRKRCAPECIVCGYHARKEIRNKRSKPIG